MGRGGAGGQHDLGLPDDPPSRGRLLSAHVEAVEEKCGQKVMEDRGVAALSCVTLTEGWFWKQRGANGHLKAVTAVVNELLEPLNRRPFNLNPNSPPTREGRLAP